MAWRTLVFWIGLVAIIASFGVQVWQKQMIIDEGRRVLLPLRPADPRSLMQGDYMRLAYAPSVSPSLALLQVMPPRGALVLSLNEQDIGRYARVDDGASLKADEVRLHYRVLDQKLGRPRIEFGAKSYFFPQGAVGSLSDARYAVLHVDDKGDAVLIGLADGEAKLINPQVEAPQTGE